MLKRITTAVLISLLLLSLLLPFTVHAEKISVSLKNTSGTVYPGCTLTLAVVASGSNVMIMQGKPVEYDGNQLTMTASPSAGLQSWIYTEGGSNFIVENPSFVPASGSDLQLLRFTFRLKESVKIGDKITVRLRDLVVSTADGVEENGFSGSLTYEVTVVERPKSTNAALASLSVSEASFTPAFSSSVTEYAMTVPHTVSSLTVNARTESSAARYSVFGNTDLQYGTNTVEVEVTAENGNKAVYRITVTRTVPPSEDAVLSSLSAGEYELRPAFDPSSYDYAVEVPAEVADLQVIAEPRDGKAKVEVAGNSDLEIGENTVTVTVTAEDGVSSSVYFLHVTRARFTDTESRLSSLTFGEYELTPAFDPGSDITAYSVTVPYETDSISPLEISLMSAYADYEVSAPELFEVGDNLVTVTCTAEDGSVTVYTLTVTREPRILNTDARIREMDIDKGTITPKFSMDVYSYVIVTDAEPGAITFKATPNDPAASAETVVFIPTPGLLNEQTVTCTAEDGTVGTYTFFIYTPSLPTPKLTIKGEPAVGSKLTAVLEDGKAGGTYRWFSGETAIEGATDPSYVPVKEDGGKSLHVEYRYEEDDPVVSEAVSIPLPENDPETEPGQGAGKSITELVVILILSAFCLGAGVLIGIFFTKKKQRKN